jgi:glycosyltransferase involved in cell wall biosynthesis
VAPGGELIAGYVGRLDTEKRVDLLAGITALDGVRLVIVGAGPAEAALRQQLPEAVFLGQRRGEELAAIYASLDVFVHSGPEAENTGPESTGPEHVNLNVLSKPSGNLRLYECLPSARLKVRNRSSKRNEKT